MPIFCYDSLKVISVSWPSRNSKLAFEFQDVWVTTVIRIKEGHIFYRILQGYQFTKRALVMFTLLKFRSNIRVGNVSY